MGLAIYTHIPYCLQRCRYCDFTTFEASQIMPSQNYVTLIEAEIKGRAKSFSAQPVSSLYFGGGTPSLLPPEQILTIIRGLANEGLNVTPLTEVTIEINPATIDEAKILAYLKYGINRFSVGAQTFSDELLRLCGRRHTADDTRQTLRLLQKFKVNYSFDLLFALPGQSLQDLDLDLQEVLEFSPPHLSAYCLTVPEGHPMASGRPEEDDQIAMFERIESRLSSIGLRKYEISNFAVPGFESRHNMAYWTDQPYWGLGLSAHSYLPNLGPFGTRFWNPKDFVTYENQTKLFAKSPDFPPEILGADGFERLSLAESMTDFGHMHLRTLQGLSLSAVRKKYGVRNFEIFSGKLPSLLANGLVRLDGDRLYLSPRGQLLSNLVFAELLFTESDFTPSVALPNYG